MTKGEGAIIGVILLVLILLFYTYKEELVSIGESPNFERFKSQYNAFSADIYNTLPISAGMLGEAVGGTIMGISGLIIGIVFATGAATWYVENEKSRWEKDEAGKNIDTK